MTSKFICFTVFFLFINFVSFSQRKKNTKVANVTLFAKVLKSTNQGFGVNYFSIKTTLLNASKDTISFLSTSCSWKNNYVVDNDDFHFTNEICKDDSAVLIKIPPHAKEERLLTVLSLQNSNHSLKKFRVGLKFIPANTTDGAFKLLKHSKNFIWSNIIIIKSSK